MLKLRSVLINSKAAIDLASIMVGIIVIGLIGGVIAATVFAVIPWAQDNAAKQQLESIHTAQNAGFGLSADPSRELPAGQERNSFTNSAGLANAGLLTLSPTGTYCTVNFLNADGTQNYIGWVKSASGKIFYSTNNSKTPKDDAAVGTLPCTVPTATGSTNPVEPGNYDDKVAEPGKTVPVTNPANPGTGGNTGGGGTTNPPATPQPIIVNTYDFEQNILGWSSGQTTGNVGRSTNFKHGGQYSMQLTRSADFATVRRDQNQIVIGDTYRVTAWFYSEQAVGVAATPNGVAGTSVNVPAKTWTKIEKDFVATKTLTPLSWAFYGQNGNTRLSVWVDDVSVHKLP